MFDNKDESKLKLLGVKDSKLLSHKRRVELDSKIKKIAKDLKIIQVKPDEIDKALDHQDGLNLNWLEARKTAEIINDLKPDKVIVDSPSPNLRAYKNYLLEFLKHKPKDIIVTHKADRDYVVVGAASILAKTAREKEVQSIEKMVGESIGSGYVSNPICQKFIQDNIDKYPEIFRKSWAPYKNQKQKQNQKQLDEFSQDD